MSDEIDEKLEAKKREYLEGKKQPITINLINSTKPKGETDNSEKSLEDQLEEERTLREDYESKLKLVAENAFEHRKKELSAPSWIDSPETLMKWAESEGKGDKGAGGVVGLRPEDVQKEKGGSGKREFDSEVEMIDYLRSESAKGN